ncbi:MAG: peptidoglycan bridge formation glycyltransferase FemA/FemB family protein [Bacteroidales bacterium]|nr:peptidoglycan bridge formation glycyltransferase FemA/FemB family protein [Bacteroidales bacterium]
MQCTIEPKDIREIERCNIPQQTAFWAGVKYQQGLNPLAFNYSAPGDLLDPMAKNRYHKEGDLLLLLQPIDSDHSIAYVPYGPVDEPKFENQGLFLEELSEILRPKLPGNCILVRYDLPWENQWAAEDDHYDEHGNWTGPPDSEYQELRVNFKTSNKNLHKSQSDNLPVNTIFLNLRNDPEQLIMKMKPKTRYNIRLSLRKGINVKSYGPEYLDEWYMLYKETAARNGVTLHDRDYFKTVLESTKKNPDNETDVRLLMADHHGQYLAAMFLVLSSKRGTYLYGASSGHKRNMMATYALQWEAIRISQESGCTEYDMFGIAPNADPSHPMYGLYRFKSGFGGHMFHRMGCWDYPLSEDEYMVIRAQEMNSAGYLQHPRKATLCNARAI